MAFGGLFGGSDSSRDKNSNTDLTETPTQDPFAFPSSSSSSQTASQSPPGNLSPSETLSRIKSSISQQNNMQNAKLLLSNVQNNCFQHCIASPSDNLTGNEQRCLSSCMEKYIEGWNAVSRTYISRLQKEGGKMPILSGGGGGGGARGL